VKGLSNQKQLKTILLSAAGHFISKPHMGNYFLFFFLLRYCAYLVLGFQYMQEKNLLPDPLDPQSVALFLRKNPFLSKKGIGEYIGVNKEFNIKVELIYLWI
jgi:hypothetical protein